MLLAADAITRQPAGGKLGLFIEDTIKIAQPRTFKSIHHLPDSVVREHVRTGAIVDYPDAWFCRAYFGRLAKQGAWHLTPHGYAANEEQMLAAYISKLRATVTPEKDADVLRRRDKRDNKARLAYAFASSSAELTSYEMTDELLRDIYTRYSEFALSQLQELTLQHSQELHKAYTDSLELLYKFSVITPIPQCQQPLVVVNPSPV